MKKSLNSLESELEAIRKKLDKEKNKRTLIMGILCSILSYWILSLIDDTNHSTLNGLSDIMENLFASIFLGFFFYFVFMAIFVSVTELFTNINGMEIKIKHLEEEIRKQNITMG